MKYFKSMAFVTSAVIALGVVTAGQDKLPDLSPWKAIISFRPPVEVQKKVRERGRDWAVHRLEDANGSLSIDIYSVAVTKLPKMAGKEMAADELLDHVRRNLNSFVDQSIARFKPFDDQEKTLWESDNPTGAIVLIDMKVFGVTSPDSGCVVTTRRTRNEWVFSTIRSGGPVAIFGSEASAHPVSGNRAFGVYKTEAGNYVIYTVAADRPTRALDKIAGQVGLVGDAQAKLWESFQSKVVEFVNNNGGQARKFRSDASGHSWEQVKVSKYYDVRGQPEWQ